MLILKCLFHNLPSSCRLIKVWKIVGLSIYAQYVCEWVGASAIMLVQSCSLIVFVTSYSEDFQLCHWHPHRSGSVLSVWACCPGLQLFDNSLEVCNEMSDSTREMRLPHVVRQRRERGVVVWMRTLSSFWSDIWLIRQRNFQLLVWEQRTQFHLMIHPHLQNDEAYS